MIKLLICDLDGTLAEPGKPILPSTLNYLKLIENCDVGIVLCSGKPVYYLCGLTRQLGLKNPILIGENGLDFQIGIDLPPKVFFSQKCAKDVEKNLVWLQKNIAKLFDENIWFQPNKKAVTVFPREAKEFDIIRDFLNKNKNHLDGLTVYEHNDSFDILPSNINKKTTIEKACKLLNVQKEEIIAVGDGVNDYPMFECSALPIGVHVKDLSKVKFNFDDVDTALEYIKKVISTKN